MASTTRALSARSFFARGGLLSRWHPNYEFRQGQLEMAEAVEAALAERRHLIVEAGTGTGKTLAYLVPAILCGRRVVISTGTKNLQEQLYLKDIPFLQQHFQRPLKVCYMKGRNNFACRQKIYDAEREPILAGLEELADYQVIREWEKGTEYGDRSEIRTLPAASTVWSKLDARRELCTGQKCQQFDRCFITLMQRRAAESDVIIVNHHLFFADMAVKQEDFGAIIPHYSAVIFDEAHEIESVAGQYFGARLSSYQLEELRRDIAGLAHRKGFGSAELDRVLITLSECASAFFGLFPEDGGRRGQATIRPILKAGMQRYQDLRGCLELLGNHLQLLKSPPEELIPVVQRARDFAQTLDLWMQAGDPRFVYWFERRSRSVGLEATPIDVAGMLNEKLFSRVETVVLASATLAVAGSFDFVEQRLGLEGARTLLVNSHFDYTKQALLYVPKHLPDPRSADYLNLAIDEVKHILQCSRGRAFVLFTSHQQMRAFHDRLSLELEYPTLLQGTGPNSALLDEFRRTPNCVLFATASFWQGVDVQGEQLSCVIIDKLPFASPSDPVVEARVRAIRESGGNAFYEYQVPEAAIALKQGFGRLIRSRSDRGILALLDTRVVRMPYGRIFLDSLPGYRFTMERGDLERFFDV
jgi:ATP-dependent DNA helicase DinG